MRDNPSTRLYELVVSGGVHTIRSIQGFISYCAVLRRAVLCCAVLCYAVLCCAVLCCAVLCRAVLCYVVLWSGQG